MATFTNAELVAQLYIGFYDRAPDPVGLNYWVGRLDAGVSIQDVGDSFAASPEAADTFPYIKFPNLFTPDQFLENVYQNVFGRAIDDDGLDYYKARIESGESLGSVVASILGNATTNDGSDDQAYVANKVAAGLHWAELAASTGADIYQDNGRLAAGADASAHGVIDLITADPASVDAANEASDTYFGGGGPGDTFVLTSLQDIADTVQSGRGGPNWLPDTGFKFTGANETVEAAHGTLNPLDSLMDGSTTDDDVLNATVNGNLGTVNPGTVANIENVNVNVANGTGTLALTNFTGVKNLTVTGSVAAAGILINGFANSGVSTIDVAGLTSTDNVGFDVSVADALAHQDITVVGGNLNQLVILGNGDNVITTGSGDDNIQVGIGNNTIDAGDGKNVVFITTDGDATTVDGNNVVTTGSGVDVVTVNGDGDNSISTGDASDSVTINGGGDNTIDTGAGNDIVVIAGTGDNTITTGDGVDTVTIAATATGNNDISTGAGNDVITLNGGTNIVTAGAGVDNITIGGTSVANELVFGDGDSGLTATTIDIVTGFRTTVDGLSFGDAAGNATNFVDAGAVADYDAALAAANGLFSNPATDVHYVFADDGANGWVFYDSGNGEADLAVQLTGVTAIVAGDIHA